MRIYIAAFFTSLFVALGATFILSGTVGPELDALANAFGRSIGNEEPDQPILEPALLLTFADGDVLEKDVVQTAFAIGLKPSAMNSIQRFMHHVVHKLDRSKPSAVAVFFREGVKKPTLLFCLPVSQYDEFEMALNEFGGVHKERGTKWIAIAGLGDLRIKQRGDYTFFSSNWDIFDRMPADLSWLTEFASKNDIGLRVDPTRIPDELIGSFFNSLKNRIYQGKASRRNRSFAQKWFARMEGLVFDTKEIMLGLDIDVESHQVTVNAQVIALEDSILATDANKNLKSAPSNFGGYYRENAGFSLNCCNRGANGNHEFQRLVATKINSLQFELFGHQPQWDETCVWIKPLVTVFCEARDEDRVDFGATSTVVDGKISTAMGFNATDPARVESLVQCIFEESQLEGTTSTCRLGFTTHRDVVFHQIERKLSDSYSGDSVYGQSLKVNIGIGKTAVYLGLGEHSLDLLKSSIDDSADAPPTSSSVMKGSFEFSPWLDIVAEDTTDLRYFRSLIKNSSSIDRLSFKTVAIENGYSTRIVIEMGFARIIWKSIRRVIDRQAYNAGAGGPVRIMSGSSGQIPFSSMIHSYQGSQ